VATENLLISADAIRDYTGTPLADQIRDALRDAIVAGRVQIGDELPSERVLANHLRRSREVVKAAYRLLAADGYVLIQHGRPAQVRIPPPHRRVTNQRRYAAVLNACRAGTLRPEDTSFIQDYGCAWPEYSVDARCSRLPATSKHANLLRVETGTPVLFRHLVERVRGVPVQIRRSVMPWSVAGATDLAREDKQPWVGGTIAELFSLGMETTSVPEEYVSRIIRPDEAAELMMPNGIVIWDNTRQFMVGDVVGEASTVIHQAAGNSLSLVTHL